MNGFGVPHWSDQLELPHHWPSLVGWARDYRTPQEAWDASDNPYFLVELLSHAGRNNARLHARQCAELSIEIAETVLPMVAPGDNDPALALAEARRVLAENERLDEKPPWNVDRAAQVFLHTSRVFNAAMTASANAAWAAREAALAFAGNTVTDKLTKRADRMQELADRIRRRIPACPIQETVGL